MEVNDFEILLIDVLFYLEHARKMLKNEYNRDLSISSNFSNISKSIKKKIEVGLH